MRVLTDCGDCGSVVLPADAILLVTHGDAPLQGVFDCPVCRRIRTVTIASGMKAVLIARGARVLAEPRPGEDAPLTLLDLAELQRLLEDDDSLRVLTDGAK